MAEQSNGAPQACYKKWSPFTLTESLIRPGARESSSWPGVRSISRPDTFLQTTSRNLELLLDTKRRTIHFLWADKIRRGDGLWMIDQAEGNKAYLLSYEDVKVLHSFPTETDRSSGITFGDRSATQCAALETSTPSRNVPDRRCDSTDRAQNASFNAN
jgi:hypothetical protein